MESVIQQIRQHRENTKGQIIINSKEAVVNGCQVKFNFDETGNIKILPIVQTILVSAYVDSLLVKVSKNIVVESNDDLIKKRLDNRYITLKGEVKEVEKIHRNVYDILREETREAQRTRTQGMEH